MSANPANHTPNVASGAVYKFVRVGGQTRWRAFMLTLGASATVNPCWYPPLQNLCQADSLPD